MGSSEWPPAFDPLDLEIIERVCEAAWARVVARNRFRDEDKDDERQKALRVWLFALAGPAPVDFDILYDKVLTTIPESGRILPDSEPHGSPEVGP